MGVKRGGAKGWSTLLSLLFLVSLTLSACSGGDPTPTVVPTPEPRFQQENNSELQFTMNIPFNWSKNGGTDSTLAVYQSPKSINLSMGVISRRVGSLTPDSQRVLEEYTDQLKLTYPGLREDRAGGGEIIFVDTRIAVNRLSFTAGDGTELIQYIAQANIIKAQRAYLLFGITPAATAPTNQQLYLDCFKSFSSTAPDLEENVSSVSDPTVVAANNGGKVRPYSGNEVRGRYLRLVDWESPPLNATIKQPRINGLFPYDYNWRLRPFPTALQPAIYLDSPVVDRSSSQASMQFGVYQNAFASASPSPDDWKKFYDPILLTIVDKNLNSYGPGVQISPIAQVGQFYRSGFVARDSSGMVISRGAVIFSRSGQHGVVSLLSLSSAASIKQELVDSFEADFEQMINSFAVRF